MSATTEITETTATEASAAKPRATKTKIEKQTKPATKDRSMGDVPAKTRRRELVKLLKKLGATSGTSARPLTELAIKLGYTPYAVYCLVYRKHKLAIDGLIKTVDVEDVKGLSAHLTTKGAKVNLDEIG